MFYLTTHSTHFIYGYMASDILIVIARITTTTIIVIILTITTITIIITQLKQ